MKFGILLLLVTLSSSMGYPFATATVVVTPPEQKHPLVDQHAAYFQQMPTTPIKQVSFSTSNSIAPYFFADQPQGVQYDLLVAALKLEGMHIKEIVHAPNLRAQRLVQSKKVDCMINTPDNVQGLFYTQSLIEYQNSVFYITKNKLAIHEIQDLNNVTVLGFQNAKQYLGEEFKALATDHANYSEISNQKSQVVMLFNGHIQSVVLEQRIFEYYRHLLKDRLNTGVSVTEVPLFDPAERKIACHDKNTAAAVNHAISSLKQSYQYQEILSLAEQNNYQPTEHVN
ncbi:substrate-binding periplasmic protein [Shewanella sp.]|uniref:substrate-binding periplasmic protein n=1 Tax=Shewanella sp. TaxID=50422 RepID=UPI0040481F03